MIDATMSETLSSYYLENESDSNRSFWCESDIIISSSQLRDLDSCTQHSFVSFGAESFYPEGSGYIAGISGLQSDSFDNAGNTENSYMFFYHTKDALSDKVIDAEKTISSSADTTLCWAATASNLLTRTGWLTSMTKTEDHVLNTYRSSFITGSTNGGNPYDGIVWYLTGNYPLNGIDGWDQLKPDFNSSLIYSPPVLNYSNYLSSQNASRYSYDYLINAVNELRDGNAVGLVLEQYVIDSSSNSRRKNGHVITLQGFTYQATDNPNDIKVTGIIIADSDDNMNFDGGNNSIGSSYAPNRLDIIPISYMFGNVYLHPWYWPTENYTPWRIVQTTTLKPAHFTTLSSCGVQVSRGATLLRETVQNGYTMNVSSSGLAMETEITYGGIMNVFSGGVAYNNYLRGGTIHVYGGGSMRANNQAPASGTILLGGKMFLDSATYYEYANVNYQLDANTPENDPLITNLSNMGGIASLGLNIDGREKYGIYKLAENGNTDFLSTKTVTVTNISNNITSGSLNSQTSTLPFNAGPNRDYTLSYAGGVMTLNISGTNANKTTRCDFHYNGISDVVLFEESGQRRIGYWLDGTDEWQGESTIPSGWDVLGGYDMNSDRRADLVVCNISGGSATVGYYRSGDTDQWITLGSRSVSGTDWNLKVGNLTGTDTKNSIVWHDKTLGTLDVWTDNEQFKPDGNIWIRMDNRRMRRL